MEKKITHYLRAVRHRLNMPKELKDRVMADFSSSIQVRMENGQSAEAIWAEFGKPKQAAAELNRQMQEYTYRKSPWRWVSLALAIVSGLCLAYRGLPGLLLMLFNKVNNAATVGIIGGADGPTAVFVTTSNSIHATIGIYILVTATGLLGFLILRKLRRK